MVLCPLIIQHVPTQRFPGRWWQSSSQAKSLQPPERARNAVIVVWQPWWSGGNSAGKTSIFLQFVEFSDWFVYDWLPRLTVPLYLLLIEIITTAISSIIPLINPIVFDWDAVSTKDSQIRQEFCANLLYCFIRTDRKWILEQQRWL